MHGFYRCDRIDLYVGNLQAFGSMAAFTAGCAYTSKPSLVLGSLSDQYISLHSLCC